MIVLGEISLKELKNEVTQLRADVNRISEALVEQRIGSVERAIASKHMKVYAYQATNYLGDSVQKCINMECSRNQECLETFKDEVNTVLGSVESPNIDEVFKNIQKILTSIQSVIDEAESKPCRTCYSNLKDLIVEQEKNLKQIIGKESEIESSSKVQVDLLIERVLKPLSHQARLRILKTLGQGSAGFSELSEVTDMRGGHLSFHLEQLVDSGLVSQRGRKGEYVITGIGLEVLEKLRAINLR